MAQFLLRSSKHYRKSYCPCLANWFIVSVVHTLLLYYYIPGFFFREVLEGLAEKYKQGMLMEEWLNPGQRKHRVKHWWADLVFYLQLSLPVYNPYRWDKEAELEDEWDALGEAGSVHWCFPVLQERQQHALRFCMSLFWGQWDCSPCFGPQVVKERQFSSNCTARRGVG